jgi:DNA excision repair protein ERCC-1
MIILTMLSRDQLEFYIPDSLRYHLLHPEYLHQRIKDLGQAYTLRVLLIYCDHTDHQGPMRELTKVSLSLSSTLLH